MGPTYWSVAHVCRKLAVAFPASLAGSWDNTGLLVEPSNTGKLACRNVMLTIDLTDAVVDEALELGCNTIVAYHPVIFNKLKRLAASRSWKESLLVKLIESRVAVYSPHSALDAMRGGMNDWLASVIANASNEALFGDTAGGGGAEGATTTLLDAGAVIQSASMKSVLPLTGHPFQDRNAQSKVVVFFPAEGGHDIAAFRAAIAAAGGGVIGDYTVCTFGCAGAGTFKGDAEKANPTIGTAGALEEVAETRFEFVCANKKIPAVLDAVKRAHPYETPAVDVYSLAKQPSTEIGEGRIVTLKEKVALADVIGRLKRGLRLEHVRVATKRSAAVDDVNVKSFAVCVGAGGSMLAGLMGVDLIVTGEMRHHDVLNSVNNGTSVILCDHTNTERGFLTDVLQPYLQRELKMWAADTVAVGDGTLDSRVYVSKRDRDPLQVV